MQDILKSIKAFLYDRAVSPLFGAFAVAWLAWNYRAVIILLDGHATLTDKLSLLDIYFSDDHTFQVFGYSFHVLGGGHLIHGFLMPAVFTWAYLYIYPKIAIPVYGHSLAKQKELKTVKQEIESSRLLTVEESRNLQREIEQLRYKADEEASAYRTRISSLTQTINTLEAQLNSKAENNKNLQEQNGILHMPSVDEFSELIRDKIEKLNDRDFELSILFGKEWENLSDTQRKEYGKIFRKVVERGDFSDVKLIKKGSGNQLIYRKASNPKTEELLRYEKRVLDRFPPSMFSSKAFENDQQRKELLKKISTYFVEHRLNEDLFDILMEMVRKNGFIDHDDINTFFENKLSPIEVDHILGRLENLGYLDKYNDDSVGLSESGKALAVDSGLTILSKKLLAKE